MESFEPLSTSEFVDARARRANSGAAIGTDAATKRLRFAVIGCGANASHCHLPALSASPDVETAMLVDVALDRARALAQQYGVARIANEHRAVGGEVDAAIVALPNDLHARVAIDLLQCGIHVLVEKPMALNASECAAMIGAAEDSGATLAVGLEFRFCSDSLFLKQFFAAGVLGKILSFDARIGVVFAWPLVSDYLLRKESSGGGVLMDFGAHVLDLLLWWLGDCALEDYADDAAGGVEANCEMALRTSQGGRGIVELSRTRNLRNTCIFTGERGRAEIDVWSAKPELRLSLNGRPESIRAHFDANPLVLDYGSSFRSQLEDFVTAIKTGRPAAVNGYEGRRSIELIERCYQLRRPLELPWC